MIANTSLTSTRPHGGARRLFDKGIRVTRNPYGVNVWSRPGWRSLMAGRSNGALTQEHARAADLLRAQGAEKARNEPVHELEIRRERRRVLSRFVEDLLTERFRVDRRARTAVDEDEFRAQDEPLPLHPDPLGQRRAAAQIVPAFLIPRDEARGLLRCEQHRSGDDQRVLIFLADLLP